MPNRPQDPPAESYTLHMAPVATRQTSPPPPRKKADFDPLDSAYARIRDLTAALKTTQDRANKLQSDMLLLRGQLANALERLGRHECPDCGESSEIVNCHHDGETCGLPECDYKHCNSCGHTYGQN